MKNSRRDVLLGLSAASVIAMTGTRSLAAPTRKTPLKNAPNIIFIMADDLGYADLGCTGARAIRTPNIDSLAANGVFLTEGYANSSICSPTRTGLLSGCYQQRFRVGLDEPIAVPTPELGLPADRRTIAGVLRECGYETALVGKWHLGIPPSHSPLQHGYDHFFGILPGAADYFRHRGIREGKDVGPGLIDGKDEIERNGYLTDILGDEAVKRIRNKSGPLFLSLHFTAPHWPWEGREDAEVARQLKDYLHYNGGSLAIYRAMVEAMDDNVGKVLSALRETGELENSIVVFTSDNGGERFSDVWPFIGMKGELLEGGIRVPILWQWPARSPKGVTSAQMMMSMDFLPTFLAIAGGKTAPGEFDGVDLSAQLTGSASNVERTFFWRMKAEDQAAVRRGNWKYLRLAGKSHLFNLAQDQHERANLADENPQKVQELVRAWDDWNRQMLPYPLDSFAVSPGEVFIDRY